MNKLQLFAVLIAVLAIGAESFRVPRQAEGEDAVEEPAEVVEEPVAEEPVAEEPVVEEPVVEEHVEEPSVEHTEEHVDQPPAPQGTFTRAMGSIKSYYNHAVDTVSGYVEDIKGLHLEEKIKNLYLETTGAITTYAGIMQDQLYYVWYQQDA